MLDLSPSLTLKSFTTQKFSYTEYFLTNSEDIHAHLIVRKVRVDIICEKMAKIFSDPSDDSQICLIVVHQAAYS